MSVRGTPTGGFAGEFEREIQAAKRKAGKKAGAAIARDRKKALGKISQRRRKAIKYSVSRRSGITVVADYAPGAVIQDTGGTIRSKRPEGMLVRTGVSFDPAQKMYRSKDKKYLFQGSGKRRKLLGTYRQQIDVKQRPDNQRLQTIAEKHFGSYADEISKNLYEG